MFNTIDYIRGIVESMTFTQGISNIIYDPVKKTTTFDACKTYWIFPCYNITIGGDVYEVLDFEINKSVTVKNEVPAIETEMVISAPHFFHGTPMQATVSLGSEKYWRDKIPFVYIIEPMLEVRDLRTNRVFDRKSDLNILFMLHGDLAKSVEDQNETAIKPADNMVFEWEKKILIDSLIGELDQAKSKNRVNYGVWVRKTNQPKKAKADNTMRLINEAISGIEYSLTIPFKREVCDIDQKCKK